MSGSFERNTENELETWRLLIKSKHAKANLFPLASPCQQGLPWARLIYHISVARAETHKWALHANSDNFISYCAKKAVTVQRGPGDLRLGGKPEMLEFSSYFDAQVSALIPMDDRALSCPDFNLRETNLWTEQQKWWFVGSDPLLPPREFQWSSSGYQVWWPAPLSAEPSH